MNVEEQGSPAVCGIVPEGEQNASGFGVMHVPNPEAIGEEIEQMRGLNCEDRESNLGLRIEGDVPGLVEEALVQVLTDGNAVEVLQADGELGGLLDSPSLSNSVEKMINEDILDLNGASEEVNKEDMAVRKEVQGLEIESPASDEIEGVIREESDEVLVTDGVENDDHEDDYVEKGDEVEFSEKGSEIREKGEKQCEYAVDEGDSGDNEEVAIDEIESPADDDEVGSADCGDGSASYEEEHLVGDSCSVYGDEAADVGSGEGDSAAGNDEEWADDEAEYSINDEHGDEGVEEEGEVYPTEGRNECGKYDDGDDNRMGMEEDSNVDEYDEYEFNSEEWLDWQERGLRYVRGGNLMHEVLKEIHSYMRVVYDVQQQVFWEDECSIALKGCIILSEIVRASPVRGLLHPESELGYQLLMNEEVIGRSLCRWAWRKFRRDWEEKLMRLDVNYYCN
nr:hypothetical protein Iba_scaffold5911CG0030 [Ipomoea batatas]